MKTIFRRTLTSIMVFTTIVISSWAASTQSTIILKNGSQIIGDIIVQRPGVDLTIDGVRAELVIEESNVRSVQNKKVKYEKLSREWKRWALENKALKGDAYGRYLEMFDIVTKNNKYTNLVKVNREESPKVIYLQIEKSTYKFDWDIINEIQKKLPSKDEVTGVDDEVITITGKQYIGTIVSQKIGNNIIIKTKDKTVELKMYEVLETKTVARSSSFSLSEQAGYSNTLVMKDGTFKDGSDVSYDILNDDETCLYKHINEKYVELIEAKEKCHSSVMIKKTIISPFLLVYVLETNKKGQGMIKHQTFIGREDEAMARCVDLQCQSRHGLQALLRIGLQLPAHGHRGTKTLLALRLRLHRPAREGWQGLDTGTLPAPDLAQCQPELYHPAGDLYQPQCLGVH